jgi:hypothetical protein
MGGEVKDKVWFVPPGSQELQSAYEAHSAAKRIENAQAFTAELRTVMVAEDLEGFLRGDNDILVTTRASLGEQPVVRRVHYYEQGLPAGTPLKNFLASTAHLCDDYSGVDRLWLEMDIVEMDTDAGERAALLSAFKALAASAGAVYPQVLPYTAVASGLVGTLSKLLSVLERDDPAIRVPMTLYGPDRPNDPPLQTGRYVVFANPVDGNMWYKLQSNMELVRTAPKDMPADVSYAVFSVDAVRTVAPEYLTSQRVATLLTQLDRGNPNTALASIDFLSDTLEQYSNFKDLKRFQQLARKDPAMLTQEEKDLMDRLYEREELLPFLPERKQELGQPT